MTEFCTLIRFFCFLLALFLLIVGLFAPNRLSSLCRVDILLADALVAWLCSWPIH